MTRVPAVLLLIGIMTAAWALLILMIFVVFELIIPISAPSGASYAVELGYAVLKLVMAGAVGAVWLYSYFLMRDMFVRVKGLDRTPTPSSSGRTPS
ncbi:MAG: hypothetical protein JRN39_02555 [Nitrososphaerota archaeon]|nr:hypothetical protein [Nitrososphaerota archaeon]MDG6939263.1 hypothetical protein [Nitrososphaerota archaeon]